jgi:hypothetical protein
MKDRSLHKHPRKIQRRAPAKLNTKTELAAKLPARASIPSRRSAPASGDAVPQSEYRNRAELERLAKIADSGLPFAWRGRVLKETKLLARKYRMYRDAPALATCVSFQKHLSRWAGINYLRLFQEACDLATSAASATTQLRDVFARCERIPPGVAERLADAIALFEGIRASFEREEVTAVAEPRSRGRPEQKELRAFALLVREQWHEMFGEWPPRNTVVGLCEVLSDPDLIGKPERWFPHTREQRKEAIWAILQDKKDKLKTRRSKGNKSAK